MMAGGVSVGVARGLSHVQGFGEGLVVTVVWRRRRVTLKVQVLGGRK